MLDTEASSGVKLSMILLFSVLVSYSGFSGQYTYSEQKDFLGGFNGTSVDRNGNSGDLGLGYVNGTTGDNLRAFYRFDETGSTAIDYGGNSRDGSLKGGISQGAGVLSTDSYIFDDSTAYVDIPQSSVPQWWNGDPVSVSAWFKTTSEGLILGNEGGDTSPGNGDGWVPSLYIDTSGNVRTSLFWHGNTRTITSPGAYDDGAWHHVVATYNGGVETLYVDGSQVAQDTGLSQTDYNSGTYSYFIGSGKWDNWPDTDGNNVGWFPGSIDELKIFNKELNSSEVEELYFYGSGGVFQGNYTSAKIDNSEEHGWNSVEINFSKKLSTDAKLEFRSLKDTGALGDTQTVDISDGEQIYDLDVSNAPDAEFEIIGNSTDILKTWELFSIDISATGPPKPVIDSPANATLENSTQWLNVSAEQQISSWRYRLDGGTNQSFSPNTTLSPVSDGNHNMTIWANNSAGIWNSTVRYFTINSSAPVWRNQVQEKDTVPATDTNKLEAQGLDAVNLTDAILATNESGVWQNKTGVYNSPINPYTSDIWATTTFNWQNNSVKGQTVGWRIWYGDESAKYTETNVKKFYVESSDTVPPSLSIFEPGLESKSTVPLEVTASEIVDKWFYNIDENSNTSFTPNTSISSISEGKHNMTVWANDSAGNWGKESKNFTVDTVPPDERNLADSSGGSTLNLNQVDISAEGSDDTSGIFKAKLSTNETGSFRNKSTYGSPVIFSNQTNSYKKAEFNWKNESFTGELGYRIWFRDKVGNYRQTATNSFNVTGKFPAPWWDVDWSTRKRITVNNTFNSENITDYSIRLNLSYEGEMDGNFSDLRFTYYNTTDGTQSTIDYWVSDKNDTEWAEIYVEVPRISEITEEYLYVYYGNSGIFSNSQKTIGTVSNPAKSCEEVNRRTTKAVNTTYYLDPDEDASNLQKVRCDIGRNNTGWELLYNYDHEGGTTPSPTEGQWPLNHTTLSHQDGIDSFGYSKSMIDSVKLRCETANHPRILHYVSDSSGIKDGILTTDLTIGYEAVSSFVYKLPEHTANLPDVAGSDTGESEPSNTLFGPAFPMYEGGQHHWSIGSPNGYSADRWECDDYPDSAAYDTLHQVWFNMASSLPLFDPRPSVTLGSEERNQLPDAEVGEITFSKSDPVQGESYELRVNITNNGSADLSSLNTRIVKQGFNGTYFEENRTSKLVSIPSNSFKLTTFELEAYPGYHRFNVTADPRDMVAEQNESNNKETVTKNVSSYQIFYGGNNVNVELGKGSSYITSWFSRSSSGVMYFSDIDASYSVNDLMPLNQTGDLNEADDLLELLGHNDSLSQIYDEDGDGNPDITKCIDVGGRNLCDIPVINSTNTRSFQTGILYDSSTGNPYDGSQNLVFLTQVNNSETGKFGTYDYEIKIPFSLGSQQASTDTVSIMGEIK